jgi:hypothetical protein
VVAQLVEFGYVPEIDNFADMLTNAMERVKFCEYAGVRMATLEDMHNKRRRWASRDHLITNMIIHHHHIHLLGWPGINGVQKILSLDTWWCTGKYPACNRGDIA